MGARAAQTTGQYGSEEVREVSMRRVGDDGSPRFEFHLEWGGQRILLVQP